MSSILSFLMTSAFWSLLIGVGGWVVARHIRTTALHEEARRRIKPESAEALATQISKLTSDKVTAAELGAYGGVTAAEFAWSWAAIDPTVVKAAAFSSDASIHSGLDFANWLHRTYDSLVPAAKEGFLNRLLGYVGEQQVADILIAQGHTVEVASSATQPVWDLLVDGHTINVKTVADVASIKGDAFAHPGVEYLVPQDAHGEIGGNIAHAVGFKHEAVKQSLKESLASAKGETAGHALGTHLPWITVGFSAYRNYKAVQQGKSVEGAIRHTVVESIGRGGGVVVGGKIGGTIGFAVGGPVGAAIGAVALGIGGALVGGSIAEEYKMKSLRAALADLEQRLDSFGSSFAPKADNIKGYVLTPVHRARKGLTELTAEVANRKARWQWWLWPDFYTVLLEEAAIHGSANLAAQEICANVVTGIIDESLRTGQYAKIGLLMSNSPAVCELVGFDKGQLDAIHRARLKVLHERKELNPSFAFPV